MEITFIGTGCGVPSNRRGPSSILIKIEGEILWVDTGPGNLRRLFEVGYTYKDIDYILYTHFHIDHIADFGPIIFASKYELDLRKKDLTVIGPPGISEFYHKLVALYGNQIQNFNYNIHIVEMKDRFATQNWEVKSIKTVHTPESIGYRIKERNGKTIVYPSDTEPFSSLIEFVKGADVAIIECAFPEPTPGHLYPQAVGEIAQAGGVKWLVVTHLYPVCDEQSIIAEIRAKYNNKITIAEDLMQIEV